MLTHLKLRDLVIVDEAELEFGPGLTALTGETGAGKSIVVDALLLRRSIKKLAAVRLPGESTRGITFYAIMRALQLRRFRNPAPRIKPGDTF